ncbi:flavin-containing monooxygenase [Streptomyces sp. NPDC048297]|uniref:flavin-containing monooxygenase n=1 Tax=Streptomyces sp. NPDC048297 TaxID=3365531 RepID=UPI00371A4ACF
MKKKSGRNPVIAIAGAGFGGLCMGVELKKRGIDSFTIFEKATDVGGIWRDNTYPGCSCDVPSHLYSFSFEKYRGTTHRYPSQKGILSYLQGVAQKYDLRRHLRLDSPLTSAEYSDQTGKRTLATGQGEVHVVDILISAVGQLHRPQLPDIPGLDDFGGARFHTAQWDHGQDLTGQNVAVIGNGSSAAQLIPIVADKARRTYVHQRTPNWVIPKPKAEFGPVTRSALRTFPFLHSFYRTVTYLAADLALTPVISRGWSARPAEWLARRHLRRQVGDPEKRAKMTPDYPIGCERIVIDSDFLPAMNREDVELVTTRISRITNSGIEYTDGTHQEFDTIVCATGFRASEFLVPISIRGKDGVWLHEEWKQGAQACLGMAFPGFPNLFFIHGPNAILGHNSNVFMIECQVHYIMNCLRLLGRTDATSEIEVRPDSMQRYRQALDHRIDRTVWVAGWQSWYQNFSGKVTNPWPASTLRYWRLTRRSPEAAFVTREVPSRT